MEGKEKNKTGKEIAEKYRFSEIDKLERSELLRQFKLLYQDHVDLGIEGDLKSQKIAELTITINNLKEANGKPQFSQYNPNWGGIEKVLYILKENKKVLRSNEIQRILIELEPHLIQKWDNPRSAVLKYISRAVKSKVIVKYKLENNYVYSLLEWLDENENLIKMFR